MVFQRFKILKINHPKTNHNTNYQIYIYQININIYFRTHKMYILKVIFRSVKSHNCVENIKMIINYLKLQN